MSCFIHKDQEGVAVCLECGKNMCKNCSSLVEHKGICPTCYKPELEAKLANLQEEYKKLLSKIIIKILIGLFFIASIIIPVICLILIISDFQKRKVIPAKIKELERQIKIINDALAQGEANI